jgi:hypothetical protein
MRLVVRDKIGEMREHDGRLYRMMASHGQEGDLISMTGHEGRDVLGLAESLEKGQLVNFVSITVFQPGEGDKMDPVDYLLFEKEGPTYQGKVSIFPGAFAYWVTGPVINQPIRWQAWVRQEQEPRVQTTPLGPFSANVGEYTAKLQHMYDVMGTLDYAKAYLGIDR